MHNFLIKMLLRAYTCRQHRHPTHELHYWSYHMQLALQDRTLHALKTVVQTNEGIESLQLEGTQSQQPQTEKLSSLVSLASQAGLATLLSSLRRWHCGCLSSPTKLPPSLLWRHTPSYQLAHISLAWLKKKKKILKKWGPQYSKSSLGFSV